jgi:ABC-type branched-subunit amino acid transport system ATPase component
MTAAAVEAAVPARAAPILTVRGLTKSFGGLVAVNGVSFDVRPGEVLGLIGPNGSGKTTVLNLITGEYRSDAGEVVLDGDDLTGLKPHRINRRRIARTFQLVRVLEGMTAAENVLTGAVFGSDPKSVAAAAAAPGELLAAVGLADKADLPAGELTYVDQKRLELARALATRPAVLLLDEWLAGLNPTELHEGIALIRKIRDTGMAIILIEHVMHAVRELSSHIVVMNAGRLIAEGAPAEVLANSEVVSAYLGPEDA